jgi:outer membrane biosynthesis protein TonB
MVRTPVHAAAARPNERTQGTSSLDHLRRKARVGWIAVAIGASACVIPSAPPQHAPSRLEPIKRCYEAALARTPGLSGEIVFHWTIMPDGHVSDLTIESASLPDAVIACMAEVVGTWVFPPPKDGAVDVSFPFTFISHR